MRLHALSAAGLAIGVSLAAIVGLAAGARSEGSSRASVAPSGTIARYADPIAGAPQIVAALGDSFNTGFAARPGRGDNPALSWSIGEDPAVASIAQRLRRLHPGRKLGGVLVARDGSKISDLARQVSLAADAGGQYLTIQTGGNDICAAENPAAITPAADFRRSVEDAFALLRKRMPNARVLLTSITDEARWNDGSSDVPGNVDKLSDGTVCDPLVDGNGHQSRLRRIQIQGWERRFNVILRDVCASNLHCRYDGGVFFRLAYSARDVAPTDAFHPSVHGLARFASAAWAAGFDFSDETPPTVSAALQRVAGGLRVRLSASGAAGSGIEYRIDASPFTTYTGALLLNPGQRLAYRAVDRNGNISAAFAVSAP